MILQPPSYTRSDTLLPYSTPFRPCPGSRPKCPRKESLGQPRPAARDKRDRGGRKSVGELEVTGEPRQVHELIGQQQRLNLATGRQADGVASIVITIAVPFFHVADLAMTDEVGTPGCRFPVRSGEDQLAARERRQGHRHVLAVDLLELGKGMDASDDRAAKVASGLQALDRKSTRQLQSLMRISYAVFCLKKKKTNHRT